MDVLGCFRFALLAVHLMCWCVGVVFVANVVPGPRYHYPWLCVYYCFFLSFFLLFLFVDDAVVAEDSQELSIY